MSLKLKTQIQEQLESLYVESHKDFSLFQEKAWKLYIEKGFPTNKVESFKYVSFQKLSQDSIKDTSLVIEKKKSSFHASFVFVDGKFSADLSDLEALSEEVIFSSLEDAKNQFSSLILAKQESMLKKDFSSFCDLNNALCKEGFFLYIPSAVDERVEIEFQEYFTKSDSVTFSKKMIFLGKRADVSITQRQSFNQALFAHQSIEIFQEAGSSLSYFKESLANCSNPLTTTFYAALKKDSTLNFVKADLGSNFCFSEYLIELLESNSEVFLKGISALELAKQSHELIKIKHLAPAARSLQMFKTLLFDQSRSSFEGKIFVDSLAQKTEAYQLCNHLLLSSEAHAFAKPNLEIFADDVKASHGATISQLSEEELFYLRARGLSNKVAQGILIKGFCQEIISLFSSSTQNKIYGAIEEKLKEMHLV
jgi:Fe-S cluster assembly protein SufD